MAFVGFVTSAVPAAVPQLPTDAKGLYDRGCAPCHGVDGAGVDLSTMAFDVPLPDFSDCTFAAREPDGDWFAVTHQGGPVRGFDRTMPAFGDGFSDEQIQLTLDHIRTLCTDDRWPRGELNLPRALVTEKAYPEDEFVWTIVANVDGDGLFTNEALYEKRFGPRSMIEVVLPFGGREMPGADESWNVGIGDIGLGFKHALVHDHRAGSILSLGGEVKFPTGSRDDGLGTGVFRFEPYVAFGQILPSDTFFQFQGGAVFSSDTDKVDHVGFWRGVVGAGFTSGRFGRSWTPMVELLGRTPFGDDAQVQWTVVPQMQVSLNTRQHVLANLGFRIPISDTERRDTQLVFYILWDWFDGGFFDGW